MEEFKKQLQLHDCYDPQKHDDYLLARFLRARQGNIEKATEMFVENQKWRLENDIDNIHLVEFPEFKIIIELS
jgi:hypothetical protein